MLRLSRQVFVVGLSLWSGTAVAAGPVPAPPAPRAAENRIASHDVIHGTSSGVQSPASAQPVFLVAAPRGHSRSGHTQGESARRPMGAVVVLRVDRTSFSRTEDVIVHVTITNPAGRPLRILKWFTPLDGVERSLFTVTRNGERVPYLGKLIKRAAPKATDYMTMMAGESVTRDVSLSDYYALSVTGHYDVAYDVASLQLYAGDEAAKSNNGRLASDVLCLFIEGRSSPALRPSF